MAKFFDKSIKFLNFHLFYHFFYFCENMGGHNKKFNKKSDKFYEDKPQNYNEDFGIKLSMWYFDQCDPKRCSGMILKSRGLLTTLSQKAKFNGIVLTPTAS